MTEAGLREHPAEQDHPARASPAREQRMVPVVLLCCLAVCLASVQRPARATPAVPEAPAPPPELAVSPVPPADLPGGAPAARLEDAAHFAWRLFIALNWPAVPQTGQPGTRGAADTGRRLGDPGYAGPLVWETFRSKTEVLPGTGEPHGRDSGAADFGYDAPPQYVFDPASVGSYGSLPAGHVPQCQAQPSGSTPPWINLSEAFEAGPEKVFAGHLPDRGDPGYRRVLYTVKVNRPQYAYIAANRWYGGGDPGSTIPAAQTAAFIAEHSRAPPPGTADYVSFPAGAMEVKGAWRRLTRAERSSGRFRVATVRSYRWQQPDQRYAGAAGDPRHPCFDDVVMGLIGLHIKVKTPSAPFYVWATFEQQDNLRDATGQPVEDAQGRIIGGAAGPPSEPRIVSRNARSASPETPETIQQLAPAEAHANPGQRLYYTNPPGTPTTQGVIAVNRRDHPIPDRVVAANARAHEMLQRYAEAHRIGPMPWTSYKLVGVQWRPADKPVPGTDVRASDTADPVLRDPAVYYLANIVIETSHRLQVWSGQIQRPLQPPFAGTPVNNLITDFNPDGTPAKNVQFDGNRPDGRTPGYNMGGCMGCHGQMQRTGYDFSFILRRGRVRTPEVDEPLRASLHEMLEHAEPHRTRDARDGRAHR